MHELDRLVDKRTSELSEANLRLSLLAAALKAAANSISITDSKGTVVWTNPAFSALSGYSAEEALGTNRRVLKSGVHEDKFYKEMWAAISSGKTWRGEVINRRKDGSLTPEEMTITPVALQAVDITHFIEINQDISERKQAEQSLLDAEEKYRAIFEDAVVGIFQATPDGRLLDSNRAFATMLGYESPEQLLADESRNSLSHVMNASHRNEWISILEKQGVIRSTELEVPCKDGTRKWVLVNARAVRNLDGVVVKHEGTVEGITDRKAAQMQIKFLAYYDALTGLPNRTLLQDRLTNALAAARRRGNLTAVLFLDLDRFKIINDSLGHSFGDLLLQQVATRLKNEVREQDTVARVGGDEFLIVLTSVESLSELELIAARIVESVSREFIIKGRTLGITCSLGISVFPEHGHDAETLVKNADSAMYCAKDKGSNSFCPFYR